MNTKKIYALYLSGILNESQFHYALENTEQNSDINSIIKEYLNSEIGKKYQEFDCKTVTRAFVNWAKEKGIHANVVLLAAPSIELVRENPKKYGGSSGEGDQHIMPVVNNHAIDFTIRQFGLPNTYFQPVITPINNLESVYSKFGYFTNTFHEGGESSYIGPLEGANLGNFPDERLPNA